MRIKLESDGRVHGTRVFDADTGETLPNVVAVSFEADANKGGFCDVTLRMIDVPTKITATSMVSREKWPPRGLEPDHCILGKLDDQLDELRSKNNRANYQGLKRQAQQLRPHNFPYLADDAPSAGSFNEALNHMKMVGHRTREEYDRLNKAMAESLRSGPHSLTVHFPNVEFKPADHEERPPFLPITPEARRDAERYISGCDPARGKDWSAETIVVKEGAKVLKRHWKKTYDKLDDGQRAEFVKGLAEKLLKPWDVSRSVKAAMFENPKLASWIVGTAVGL